MATKSFYLTFQSGPERGRRVEITGRNYLLGRDIDSDLVVNDIEVSRRHARLIAQSDGYVIEDMGSTNGTYVDGQRLTSVLSLSPGASIRLGESISLGFSVVDHDEADTDPRTAKPEAPPAEPSPFIAESQPQAPVSSEPPPPALATESEIDASPRRETGRRPALLNDPWGLGCGILFFLGLVVGIALLWYVDANYLWCDVFGGLIPACR